MPELPEVEITKRGLWSELHTQPVLEGLTYFRPDLRWELPKKAQKLVPGQKILEVRRRGKYLLFQFEKSVLVSHLGMSGTWRRAGLDEPLRKHDHIEFLFSGRIRLLYHDPRRFGFLHLLESPEAEIEYFSQLGYEPLDERWKTEDLWSEFRKQKRALKVSLMDQQNIVGVGNIYASESLFLAKLSPFMKASKITIEQLALLRREISKLLEKSIQSGGSSIQDFAHASGSRGNYQNQFLVYDKSGSQCSVCGTKIKSKTLVGRATYWCPKCQGQAKK